MTATPVSARRRSIPPGPRACYPGQLLRLLAHDKLAFFAELARHGDVSQVRFGPRRLVLFTHPDDARRVLVSEQRKFVKGEAISRTEPLLGQGLLTSQGDFHLRQRRMIQPGLHRERLAGYGQVMVDYTERMQAGWTAGQSFDVHEEMMRLTLAIAGRTLFDVDVERDAREVGEVLDLNLRMFRYAVLPLGTLLEYLPLGWIRQLHRARRRMDELIARMIAERRKDAVDRGDLLSMLLRAQDEMGHTGGMTDRQLRDELVTLLLAGHETTANALSWSWYLLSQHPAVEAKLHAELDAVLGDRIPTPADAPRLVYTRSILAEAMRLFPPAWILEREVHEEFEAGGYRFPVGTMVFLSPYLTHRDARWWPTPTRFDPDRWTPEQVEERPKFSYFPFGGGTRICVGEHFAWLEATLVLAAIARRWQLRYDESHEPMTDVSVTLRPRGGLRVRLEARPARSLATTEASTCV
jgi:cytochrome P450